MTSLERLLLVSALALGGLVVFLIVVGVVLHSCAAPRMAHDVASPPHSAHHHVRRRRRRRHRVRNRRFHHDAVHALGSNSGINHIHHGGRRSVWWLLGGRENACST